MNKTEQTNKNKTKKDKHTHSAAKHTCVLKHTFGPSAAR